MAMLMRLAPTEQVIAKLPWSPILLIAGVFTLIGVVEKMGMIELASQALSQLGSGSSLYAGLALAAGGLSAFSSSSGVVLPLFLPMVPSMVQPPDPGATLELVNTIVLSAHLVDCSPLSSLGALCLTSAGVSREHDKGGMFRKLLLWGFAMIPVGAVVCVVVYQIIG
jgi:Na+/H+ antiporter NhaD/arsenite permease-like protein